MFLHQLGLSAVASSAWPLLKAGAVPTPANCHFQAHSLLSASLEKFVAAVDPGSDAFLTERYALDLNEIFENWSAALRATPSDLSPLKPAIALDIDSIPLNQGNKRSLRNGGAIHIEAVNFEAAHLSGRAEFLNSLSSYLHDFDQIYTAEFLINDISLLQQSPVKVEIEVRYDIVGSVSPDTREERVGLWSLGCQADTQGKWQIHRWHAKEETRAAVTGSGFVDITSVALHGATMAEKQFAHGIDFWRSTIDAAVGPDIYGNNGVAVGDFDGDGFDDFYVCQPTGLPNRLFRNRGDGTFDDVTEGSGLGLLDGTASALFADFTNSGTQDLIVVRTGGPLLYLNRGRGTFELKADAFRFRSRQRARSQELPLPITIVTACWTCIFVCTPTIKG